jgi:hypothetical protein
LIVREAVTVRVGAASVLGRSRVVRAIVAGIGSTVAVVVVGIAGHWGAMVLRRPGHIGVAVLNVVRPVSVPIRAACGPGRARFSRTGILGIGDAVAILVSPSWRRTARPRWRAGGPRFGRARITCIRDRISVRVRAARRHRDARLRGATVFLVRDAVPIPIPLSRPRATLLLHSTALARASIVNIGYAIIIQVGATTGCQGTRLIWTHVLIVRLTVAVAIWQPDRLDADGGLSPVSVVVERPGDKRVGAWRRRLPVGYQRKGRDPFAPAAGLGFLQLAIHPQLDTGDVPCTPRDRVNCHLPAYLQPVTFTG